MSLGRPINRWEDLIVFEARPGDGTAWANAKRVELDTFAVANGWATDADLRAGEVLDYRPFDATSQIFLAARSDAPHVAVGVARMIWGGEDGLSGFMTPRAHRLDPAWVWFLDLVGSDHLAEWATLGAIDSDASPMFALWSTIYRLSRSRGVDHWIQSVVEPLLGGYRDAFKMPMMQIGEEAVVVGARSFPTIVFLEEAAVGVMLGGDTPLKRRLFPGWVDRPRPAFPSEVIDLREPTTSRDRVR